MERYKGHASGVVAYEIGEHSIAVLFRDEHLYLYTVESAGWANVERMKLLARQGKGLGTYISQHVKDRFASRTRWTGVSFT